jgi:hypothetical protein
MDEVDDELLAQPRHWDIQFIRNFMLVARFTQLSQLQNCLARAAYRTRGDREYRILQACVG